MKAVGYPTWLSNLKILLDYNKPGAEVAEIHFFLYVLIFLPFRPSSFKICANLRNLRIFFSPQITPVSAD
jgi:hypothetical protein